MAHVADPSTLRARVGTARPRTVAAAWAITLLASALPEAISYQVIGLIPAWIGWGSAGLLAACLVLTWAAPGLRWLRLYLTFLLVNLLAWRMLPVIRMTAAWAEWESRMPWAIGMLSIQLLKLGIAALTLTALFVLMRTRRSFFFVRGEWDALGDPVPWLGMRELTSWKILGPSVAFVGAAIVTIVMGVSQPPRMATVMAALPLLPTVLLLSVANAFSEEVSYRNSLLAPLHGAVGKRQALALTAVYFGLAHYSGGMPLAVVPSILLTGLLGWLMGKSMLETRGFAWAWVIHAVNDIPVFAFLAFGAVAAAGV